MRKVLALFLMVFIATACYAHEDFYVTKDYGNVTVRIETGFEYAEIQKMQILGKLGEKLLKNTCYKGKVFIDYEHRYTETLEPKYFISYQSKEPKKIRIINSKIPDNSLPILYINIAGSRFDYRDVLELLKYGIENGTEIEKSQYKMAYGRGLLTITSIDTLEVKSILSNNKSTIISNLLKERTYVADSTWGCGTSYFYQDDSYHFLTRCYRERPDTIALVLKDMFQVVDVDNNAKLVFDTDSSFIYISYAGSHKRIASKRHVIRGKRRNYDIFSVKYIGDDMLAIYFRRHITKEEWDSCDKKSFSSYRTENYDIKKYIVIPDIRMNVIENPNNRKISSE